MYKGSRWRIDMDEFVKLLCMIEGVVMLVFIVNVWSFGMV